MTLQFIDVLTNATSQVQLIVLKVDIWKVSLIKVFKNDIIIEASYKYDAKVDVRTIHVVAGEEGVGDNDYGQPG